MKKKTKKTAKKRSSGPSVRVVSVNPSHPKRKAHKRKNASKPRKKARSKRRNPTTVAIVTTKKRAMKRRHHRRNPSGGLVMDGLQVLGGAGVQIGADYAIDQVNTSQTNQAIASAVVTGGIVAGAAMAGLPMAAASAAGAGLKSLFDRGRVMLAEAKANAAATTKVANTGGANGTQQAQKQGLQAVNVRELGMGAPRSTQVNAQRLVRGGG